MFGRTKKPSPVQIVQDEANPIAFDTNKIKDPALLNEVKATAISLKKRDLQGIRARVVVLVDVSTSMRDDYRDGHVQTLIRRCLAFGLNVDTDGIIEVIPFGYGAGSTRRVGQDDVEVTATTLGRSLEPSTNLTAALERVAKMANDSDEVIYCFVVTDGNPNDVSSAVAWYIELSKKAVFVKNVALREVPFLSHVDQFDAANATAYGSVYAPLATRVVDNCNTQFIADPAAETAESFAEKAAIEWHDWFIAAQHAGILA